VRSIDGWRRWRGWFDSDGYPRMWGQLAHRLIYEWEQGPIPPRWTIDHTCGEKDCLDHLEAVTLGENLRRRHARERGELPIGHDGLVPPGLAAALSPLSFDLERRVLNH
jgi:HNH endonuclease